MTAALPLPFAALAMIAQRKPIQDKGFEELQRSLPDPVTKVPFFQLRGIHRTAWYGSSAHLTLVFANDSRVAGMNGTS
ncbi:hypothetical protein [Paraburkholderia sp.]|uniref:hypothetical protein n=1 Tax=Paraburkholderia sp. TaxID=1926495 RepID=UPI003D6E2BCE